MKELLFLVKPLNTVEYLEKKYSRLTYDLIDDKEYHFNLLLNNEWKIVDIKPKKPDFETNLRTIALFKKVDNPIGEIEVMASLIPRDVHPADWLELWLSGRNAVIINNRNFHTDYGIIGDYLAVINEKEKVVLRAISLKDNNKIFTLVCRAYELNYNEFSEAFLMAISSFALAYPTGKKYAEEMSIVKIDKPANCSFIIPASWIYKREKNDNQQIYSATWYNYKDNVAIGTFSLIAVNKKTEQNRNNLLKKYLENFKINGFTYKEDFKLIENPEVKNNYNSVILLVDKKNNQFELKCLVKEDTSTFFLFALCSYVHKENYDIYIINKRAFDIAVNSFKINLKIL